MIEIIICCIYIALHVCRKNCFQHKLEIYHRIYICIHIMLILIFDIYFHINIYLYISFTLVSVKILLIEMNNSLKFMNILLFLSYQH